MSRMQAPIQITRTGPGLCRLALATIAIGGVGLPVAAQPGALTKPVTVIVTFPPGAATDTFARLAARRMTELLGQQVVVMNRDGAGGIIGTNFAAKAQPDGYTLLWGTSGPMTISAAWMEKLPYDVVNDFTPIGVFTTIPFFLVTHPSLPVKNVKELVALAKAQPGKLNYASGGVGGISHFAAELFKEMTKINVTHVPYRGTAIFETELISGQVEMAFVSPTVAQRNVNSGRLRALAATDIKRSSVFPEVPTMKEAGVTNYQFTQWYGLLGPAKLPPALVSQFNAALMKSLDDPEVRKRVVAEGGTIAANTPEQFAAAYKAELAQYEKIIKAAGLKVH